MLSNTRSCSQRGLHLKIQLWSWITHLPSSATERNYDWLIIICRNPRTSGFLACIIHCIEITLGRLEKNSLQKCHSIFVVCRQTHSYFFSLLSSWGLMAIFHKECEKLLESICAATRGWFFFKGLGILFILFFSWSCLTHVKSCAWVTSHGPLWVKMEEDILDFLLWDITSPTEGTGNAPSPHWWNTGQVLAPLCCLWGARHKMAGKALLCLEGYPEWRPSFTLLQGRPLWFSGVLWGTLTAMGCISMFLEKITFQRHPTHSTTAHHVPPSPKSPPLPPPGRCGSHLPLPPLHVLYIQSWDWPQPAWRQGQHLCRGPCLEGGN